MLPINAALNCEVISKSFADLLKLNFSLICKSLLTDLAPLISQANLVIFILFERIDVSLLILGYIIFELVNGVLIGSKNIKAVNYNIDTYKKKIYVYGIAQNKKERDEVIKEAKQILDVEDVVTSIFLVDDLRVVKK